ncbi:hypothetical protein SDC9_159020 [bioreactor metagenome]|uniref:Uncharacterized protein n=1 Tax=bioreactor metagenome TaxID=1076179 RepID=A0A645FHI1_9ZZZZ
MAVLPSVVGCGDHDVVSQHAATPDGDGVDRVEVAAVSHIGVGADAQAAVIALRGEPGAVPDQHAVSDADPRNPLEEERPDDHRAVPDVGERAAQHGHGCSRDVEAQPGSLLYQELGHVHGCASSCSGVLSRSYRAIPSTRKASEVKKTSPSCQAHTSRTMMAPSAAHRLDPT